MTASLHTLGLGRDAGAYYTSDPNREAVSRRRDEYYARDGGGVWWSTGETVVCSGVPIDLASFRDLCAGYDPRTGKALVRAAGEGHRAGWDVTFSAPKSVSVLWMAGDDQRRARLEEIHRAAVDEALRFLVDEHLVECRFGAGGHLREAPTDVIVGRFDHFTSRAGDPNAHTHCVLMNAAGCSDGKHRTLEPEKLFDWQVVVGAAYRAALAERLVGEGFRLRAAGRDQIEIDGIDQAILETFSKRSHDIEAAVGRDASGAQKELAALQTRGAKDEVPVGEVLEERWREELGELGVDPWQTSLTPISRDVEERPVETEREFDPPEIEGETPVARAASDLFRHQSVVTRRDLMQKSLAQAALLDTSIAAVRREIDTLVAEGRLLRLDADHWTAPGIAEAEARLLRSVDRPDERAWFARTAVEEALAKNPLLSEEQNAAVQQCVGRDGVAILEAGAGTGKTTTARALVEAAHLSGLRVLGLAPSWVAADELGKSIGIEAQAVARWRWDVEHGRSAPLDARTVVVVDEAGMIGVRDMAAIAEAASTAGAKVIVIGDRRQLESVSGGSALRAVHDVVGRCAVLEQVRRQEVSWQQAASKVMVAGDTEAGLRAYARHDRIDLVTGEEAARAATLDRWKEFRQRHGDDVLIVTRRNVDAAELNRGARQILRDEGRLSGADIRVPSLDREGRFCDLPLAVGDRLRFGESLRNVGLRNGTLATVTEISPLQNGEVTVSLAHGGDRHLTVPWSSLVPERRGKGPLSPRVTHAYAGTVYAVQGRTAAATVMYIARPTEAREIYVGLTRHRLDAQIVVAQDRLDRSARSHQADGRIAPTRVALLEGLHREAGRYAEKSNVVDFVGDRVAFVREGVPNAVPAGHQVRFRGVAEIAQRLRRTMEAGVEQLIAAVVRRVVSRERQAPARETVVQAKAHALGSERKQAERAGRDW